jgi:hypothetical protein
MGLKSHSQPCLDLSNTWASLNCYVTSVQRSSLRSQKVEISLTGDIEFTCDASVAQG